MAFATCPGQLGKQKLSDTVGATAGSPLLAGVSEKVTHLSVVLRE